MDIVVKGRHTEVPDRFRQHAVAKLTRLERLDAKVIRLDAELSRERNPRLAGSCERIELTLYSRGPVVRAEAAAADPYAALDLAAAKLEERLRRAADRRHGRQHGHGATPRTAAPPAAPVAAPEADAPDPSLLRAASEPSDGPMVVREKAHRTRPMTLDDALHEMELVGHDFYLYCDRVSGLPSVVYRRRGYDYGVLRLVLDAAAGD